MSLTPYQTVPKFLSKFLWTLLYALPAVLFFSYYPIISLGGNDSMNFELSLPLLWLVLFDLTSFVALLHIGKKHLPHKTGTSLGLNLPGLSDKRFFLFSIFPLYATISIFWSQNPTRAILTAGIIWLIFFAVFFILFIMPLLLPRPNWRRNLVRSFFISTALICVFCWVQCFLDLAGLSRNQTLLCAGCTSWTFGFPHPSGFAIEPQFMGNLLLAPTLLALFLLAFHNNMPRTLTRNRVDENKTGMSEENRVVLSGISATNEERMKRRLARNDGPSQVCPEKQRVLLAILVFLFSSTLFLTLSRGAIYAYAIALLILLIFAICRRARWQYIIIVPVITFAITLVAQGIFSAVGPTSETFYSGVSKVVHQLSLGVIDIRPRETPPSSAPDSQNSLLEAPTTSLGTPEPPSVSLPPNDQALVESSSSAISDANQAIFDGYVAASTDIRLGLNSLALRTWSRSPSTILFGAGLGGAGVAMFSAFPTEIGSPKEIVQNEPLSLLLELGLVGIILIIFSLLLAFFAPIFPPRFLDGRAAQARPHKPLEIRLQNSVFWSNPALPLLLSLFIAYFITLNFFSGLPNALHIYLLPPLLFLVFSDNPHHLIDD